MHHAPTQFLDSCRVLAIASTPETEALFQKLLHLTNQPTTSVSDDESSPPLSLALYPFSYEAVTLVAREQRDPFALVIVEVPQGEESKATQIVGALYHADARLHIILLTGSNTNLEKSLTDAVYRSNRLAILPLPCDEKGLFHLAKVMSTKWLRERQIETFKQNFDAPHDPWLSQPNLNPTRQREASASHVEPNSEKTNGRAEAIAGLASGIAHEFNNVLTVIQNQTAMAIQQIHGQPAAVELLKQVMECTRNASNLSRRLVSLAPKERGKPEAIQLAAFVDDEIKLLRKTLGEHIALQSDHAADLPMVWAEPSAIGQVIINVAVHARESMPGGGTLQFTTRRVEVETGSKHLRVFPSAKHGSYVMLTIEDPNPAHDSESGSQVSMSPGVPGVADLAPDDRIAWIRDTMQVCGGALNATLIPGMVRLYQLLFPLAAERANLDAVSSLPPVAGLPDKIVPSTVLVVDDDETICMVITQVLGMENHRVLVANNADEGWRQWRQHSSSIKLVITDINMPGGANGIALGQAVQEEDRTVPVIYTSGYRATHQFEELTVGTNYLPKPFGMSDLLNVVSRNLAGQEKTWSPLRTVGV